MSTVAIPIIGVGIPLFRLASVFVEAGSALVTLTAPMTSIRPLPG
jgi:hypothetical protein